MALYDQVIDQQRSLYPGSNVLEISIPPPQSKLERYPGETEMGVGVSPAILELMRQRQRWSPPPQDVPQDVPPMRVVPIPGSGAMLSRPPAPQPFGFHTLAAEDPNSALLPAALRPYWRRVQQVANIPPGVISAEASIPHQVLSSVLHPLFRLLFTGTPFSQQNALTRRFPGLSPGLPGRTAMGALADPAASLGTMATEMEVAPEKLFGGAKFTSQTHMGNPKGYSLRGTIPGAVYDALEDLGTGTTRRERAIKDLKERMYWKERMDDEEALALQRKLPTQPLGGMIPEYLGKGGGTRQGPLLDLPDQWYAQKYGGTDYMDRYEKHLRVKAALDKLKQKIPVQIVQPDLTKK